MRLISSLQQRFQQMPPSWANTEPDSTSAWTRWPASCPPRRGWTRRWGPGCSTTCPAAWARWCPWTTRSRPRPSRRIWLSLFTCSSPPLSPSAALPWAPNSVLQRPCPPRSLVGSSWCPQQTDSSLFWSLTMPLPPPLLLSSPFTQTRECLLRLTAVLCTAAQHRLQHPPSTAWRPSLGGPRRSARLGSAPGRRAASLCGGPGSLMDERLMWNQFAFLFQFRHLSDCAHTAVRDELVTSPLRDGDSKFLNPPSSSRCFVLWNEGCLTWHTLISYCLIPTFGRQWLTRCTCRRFIWLLWWSTLYEKVLVLYRVVMDCYIPKLCFIFFVVLCRREKQKLGDDHPLF